MSDKKSPHEQMPDKNNGLSSMQEVLYQEEYKSADKIKKEETNNTNKNRD